MSQSILGNGGPDVVRVELSNFIQKGPTRTTGQFGTQLDFADDGRMMFLVEVVDAAGDRMTLLFDRSYETAIVEAEEAAREWGVTVRDTVEPMK